MLRSHSACHLEPRLAVYHVGRNGCERVSPISGILRVPMIASSTSIAISFDASVMKSWSTASGRPRREIASHLGGVDIVARTPNDKFLITSGSNFFDTAIKIWDGPGGKLVRTIELPKEPKEVAASAIAVSSDSEPW